MINNNNNNETILPISSLDDQFKILNFIKIQKQNYLDLYYQLVMF
jgi:hypothetical protein